MCLPNMNQSEYCARAFTLRRLIAYYLVPAHPEHAVFQGSPPPNTQKIVDRLLQTGLQTSCRRPSHVLVVASRPTAVGGSVQRGSMSGGALSQIMSKTTM